MSTLYNEKLMCTTEYKNCNKIKEIIKMVHIKKYSKLVGESLSIDTKSLSRMHQSQTTCFPKRPYLECINPDH